MKDPDDSELVGTLSMRLSQRLSEKNAAEAKAQSLEEELARVKAELEQDEQIDVIKTELLKKLRKHAFWGNDMEFVKWIDEGLAKAAEVKGNASK